MKKIICVLVMMVLMSVVGCGKIEKTITISKEKIQEAVNVKFPIDKNMILARVTMANPKVYFANENIGFICEYAGQALSKSVNITVDVQGKLVYNKDKGEFYLQNFEVIAYNVNSSANFEMNSEIRDGIVNILNNYMDKYPVYTLSKKDMKQRAAKRILKDIRVDGDNLLVMLSL